MSGRSQRPNALTASPGGAGGDDSGQQHSDQARSSDEREEEEEERLLDVVGDRGSPMPPTTTTLPALPQLPLLPPLPLPSAVSPPGLLRGSPPRSVSPPGKPGTYRSGTLGYREPLNQPRTSRAQNGAHITEASRKIRRSENGTMYIAL